MKRTFLIAAGIVTGLVTAVAIGQTARSEPAVESVPNCAYQEVIHATVEGSGYGTPQAAAAEVVQAIVKGGGRPDGTPVGQLTVLGNDNLTFFLPELNTSDANDGYGLIVVEEAPEGGYLASGARFCQGSIPSPFPWGLGDG